MSENKQYTLEEVTAFLCGETQLDGVWFGEKHPTERGLYWWRKHLHAAVLSASAGEKLNSGEFESIMDALRIQRGSQQWEQAALASCHFRATNSMQSTKEEK